MGVMGTILRRNSLLYSVSNDVNTYTNYSFAF